MTKYKEIPFKNEKPLINILTQDTSAISLFIPLRKVAPDEFPIPESFLKDLSRQAKFFQEKGMTYVFATDSKAMTEEQYNAVSSALNTLNVTVLDISTLPAYIPFDKSFSRASITGKDAKTLFAPHAQYTEAEYIDTVKIMLANLAGQDRTGQKSWGNLLITDFDIYINDTLQIAEGNNLAFTFSGRHEKPSTAFDTENSMIFISKERAKDKGGVDIIENSLKTIMKTLTDESTMGRYGCFAFSTLCHDPIVALNMKNAKDIIIKGMTNLIKQHYTDLEMQEEALIEFEDSFAPRSNAELATTLEHVSYYRNENERYRRFISQECTSTGDFLIHGDYNSPNNETWKTPSALKYCKIADAEENLTTKPIDECETGNNPKVP